MAMPVEIAGFAQVLARCVDFDTVEPPELEVVLAEANEVLEMEFAEPSVNSTLIRSGSQFTHLLFVQHGTVVPLQYPYSELEAPFLIGDHEFLMEAERWVASYSAITESFVVWIPVSIMQLVVEHIPTVRSRMHQLVMRRLARFYWTSLATSGTASSRVAAALVSRLALSSTDSGQEREIPIRQKDLTRLTAMSRSAVADGLTALANERVIRLGTSGTSRFAGIVMIPDVDLLKDHAFEVVKGKEIRSLLSQSDEE